MKCVNYVRDEPKLKIFNEKQSFEIEILMKYNFLDDEMKNNQIKCVNYVRDERRLKIFDEE